MTSNRTSLRNQIDKWLAPAPGSPIALSRLRCAKPTSLRCVRAESIGTTPGLAILFFRHSDGSWCVFPPASERPAMRAVLMAE